MVGALQLDVLAERLKGEYGIPVSYETPRFTVCRWISADDPAELDRFMAANRSSLARDLDGAPVFLAGSAFLLQYELDRWKALRFEAIKDYQKRQG